MRNHLAMLFLLLLLLLRLFLTRRVCTRVLGVLCMFVPRAEMACRVISSHGSGMALTLTEQWHAGRGEVTGVVGRS